MTWRYSLAWSTKAVLVVALAACGDPSDVGAGAGAAPGSSLDGVEASLRGGLAEVEAHAESVDAILRPLPLLTATQEGALRRFLNEEQLQRARTLGVPRPALAELDSLEREGRLVRLDSTSTAWVVGELDVSAGFVTPDARALLVELGERFHKRLEELELPLFRFEISSALRTADDQAELRRTNPNAASGVSTHEFGTTVDVLYSRFAAPAVLDAWVRPRDPPWVAAHLASIAEIAAERVAARRAHELKAILGEVLLEMQREGRVMVTLERQQPVYHMTVARSFR